MKSLKITKIEHLLTRAISNIICKKINDPRLGVVAVTDIDLSPDFKNCKIYISVLGNTSDVKSALICLNHAIPFIKKEIAASVRLKNIPKIRFYHDDSSIYGEQINTLLEEL